MPASLTLAGFSFPQAGAGGGPDANGVRWNYTVDGWDDGPDMRTERLSKVGVWGAQAGEWVYEPRALVFHGFAYAGSESGMWAAQENLAKLSDATEQTVELRVTNPLRSLAAQVRRSGAAKIAARTDRVVEFQIPLSADDPRKYAVADSTRAFSGTFDSETATMAGNAFRVPIKRAVLTVGGSGAVAYRIRNNTDDFVTFLGYEGPMAAGEVVTFDWPTQTVSSSTRGDVTQYVNPVSIWHDLIRGSNAMDVFFGSGGGSTVLSWRDGWI